MELVFALIFWAIIIIIIGSVAYWVITKFFTGDLAWLQMPLLALVGLILLMSIFGAMTGYLPSPIKFPR